MTNWLDELDAALDERRQHSALRKRVISADACGSSITVEGKTYHNFSSNDYLGLANHSAVKTAAVDAINRFGVGAGASHLVTGHHSEHHKLEQELAAFVGREAAIVFESGFKANNAILETLLGKGDAVYQDKLNHASLIDGGLHSGAKLWRYPHADIEQLTRQLDKTSQEQAGLELGGQEQNSQEHSKKSRRMIVSDSVFSMDGDIAPVAELAALAREHSAVLMLDDAHGFGVLGSSGAGIVDHAALSQEQLPILMATLGKALGVSGAFIAGSQKLIDTMVNGARSYIYSTAMPPAMASAARAALRVVQQEPQRREYLQDIIRHFQNGLQAQGFSVSRSPTAIQVLVVVENELALRLSQMLREKGFWVTAIRPPTVPPKTARLRITLSASHSKQQLDGLLQAIEDSFKQLSIDPSNIVEQKRRA